MELSDEQKKLKGRREYTLEQRRGQEQIWRASGNGHLWGSVYAGEGKISRVQALHSGLDQCVFSASEVAKTINRQGGKFLGPLLWKSNSIHCTLC